MANENIFLNFEPIIYITLLLGGAFAFLTLVFSFAMQKTGLSTGFIICVIVLFVFGILIVVIYFFIYMLLIGGKNYDGAIVYTLVIASIPTVFTAIVCFSKTFVSIFENTTGYWLSYMYKSDINNIFELNKGIIESKYLEHFEQNKQVLITLFEYYDNFAEKYKNYKNTDEKYNFFILNEGMTRLKEIVYFKHTIGILSWFFISSLFASIISIKILSRI